MKTKLFLLLLTICSVGFYSCDDDDDVKVSSEFEYALNQLYPDAYRVSWEKKRDFYVAEFQQKESYQETEAWFNKSAEWKLTVIEMNYTNLPAEVKESLDKSDYRSWYIDDVDKVERPEKGVIYVLEVEEGKKEYDLYFSADGALLQAIPDNDRINKYLNLLNQNVY